MCLKTGTSQWGRSPPNSPSQTNNTPVESPTKKTPATRSPPSPTQSTQPSHSIANTQPSRRLLAAPTTPPNLKRLTSNSSQNTLFRRKKGSRVRNTLARNSSKRKILIECTVTIKTQRRVLFLGRIRGRSRGLLGGSMGRISRVSRGR